MIQTQNIKVNKDQCGVKTESCSENRQTVGTDTTSRIPLPANEVGNYRARWTEGKSIAQSSTYTSQGISHRKVCCYEKNLLHISI